MNIVRVSSKYVKKVFKILRDIIVGSPTKLITPEDIRKLSVVFSKHREMFAGYRAYLSRPEDRFSSRHSSPMSSRPQTANSMLQTSAHHGGEHDHVFEAIKLEDQAGDPTARHMSAHPLGELTHIIETAQPKTSKARAVSAMVQTSVPPSVLPVFEESTKKLNRTLKMVKKLVQATEERLKDQNLLKRRKSRKMTVDGRIVLSELKKRSDFIGDEELPDNNHASRAKKLAVEKCAARVYVLNEPNRYTVPRSLPAAPAMSEPRETEILEGNTRAKRAAQEAAREAAVVRGSLLCRLKPVVPSIRPDTAHSEGKKTGQENSKRPTTASSTASNHKSKQLAAEVEAARRLATIPPNLTNTQAEVLVACRMGCEDSLETVLAGFTIEQRRQAVSFNSGHLEGPLDCAVRQGKLKLAELLLKNGADPNKASKNGDTPMHTACRRGDRKVASQFIRCSKNS